MGSKWWFLEGECSLSILFVLNIVSFVEGKKNDYILSYSHFFIVNLVGQFVFPTHKMFFQPRHGTIILLRSAWLQHCTMPIWGEGRQLGCALYLRKQTLSQYAARQANLFRINRALNEYLQTRNSIRRREKGKIDLFESALCITYHLKKIIITQKKTNIVLYT